MRHFFLETEPGHIPVVGETVTLDQEESHHLGTVLRGGRQNEVVLTDGRGHRMAALVVKQDRRQATLDIQSVVKDEAEFSRPQLVLAIALIKPKRFEWALEKAVELGVNRIVPLQTEHSSIDKSGHKIKRWNTIMKSAIKQCGRSFLPELSPSLKIDDFLAQHPLELTVFGAIPEEVGLRTQPRPLLELAAEVPREMPEFLTGLIGPEGGWSPEEVASFLELGLQPINLGPHILRAETAASACLAGLQAVRGKWLKG